MRRDKRDYDEVLADADEIHSLCPCSEILELSGSTSNFHREFSEFESKTVVDRV